MGNIGNALVVEDSKFFSELVSKSIAERTGLERDAGTHFRRSSSRS